MEHVRTTGMALRISVNGAARVLPSGASVLDAARDLQVGDDDRGVAIALNGTVVRRADWGATRLGEGDRLEVVRAAAGG